MLLRSKQTVVELSSDSSVDWSAVEEDEGDGEAEMAVEDSDGESIELLND